MRPVRVGIASCVLSFVAVAAPAQDVIVDCTIDDLPIWDEARAMLQRVRDDPFAEVLEVYQRDLEQLLEREDGMKRRAREWYENECLPAKRAGDAQRSQCSGELSESQEARCASLLATATNLKTQAMASAEVSNQETRDVEARLRSAIDRATDVLAKEAVERMFARLAQRVHDSGVTDCEALARLLGALGKKVDGDIGLLRHVAGAVLANGVEDEVPRPQQGYVRFHQSGFRAQYLDPDANSDNQVRHFVGYFVLGAGGRSSRVLELVASQRDKGQLADYTLGLVAGNMGAKIAAQPSFLSTLEGSVRGAACE